MGVFRGLRLGSLASLCACAISAQSVVVLPFVNRTPSTVEQSSGLDWIGESIAENIREALASKDVLTLDRADILDAYERLHLKTRTPVTEASILKLGEALDAEQMVYGSFTFTPSVGSESKGFLRVTAKTIDRRQLRSGKDFNEEGKLEDLARMEAHLAWRTLAAVAPKVAPPEAEFAALRPALRLDAEEYYVRGLLADEGDQEKLFKQAATLEPRFSRPCLQLGKIYYERKMYREAATWLERVSTPTDVHFREASFWLGLSRFAMADYPNAQKAFQAVVAVVPLSEVLNNLAASESRRNLPQAVEDFRKALEGDPNDPDYHFNLGYVLWKKGDFAGAAERFRAVLARDPDDEVATILLGRCLKKQGFRAGEKGPDTRFQALERIKTNYEERAYRQLKAVLESKNE